jgi:YggT family protein
MSPLTNALMFLMSWLTSIIVGLFLLRALFQACGASFYNPICQFVYKLTNKPLWPLRRFVPRFRNWDTAALFAAWLLGTVCGALTILIAIGQFPTPLGWALLGFIVLIETWIRLMIGLIFLMVIFSFVQPREGNAVTPLVYQLTAPLLAPVRRVLPTAGPFDFSPMVVLLALYLVQILVVAPMWGLTVPRLGP